MIIKRYLFNNRFEIHNRVSEDELILKRKEKSTPDEKKNWLLRSLFILIIIYGSLLVYIYNELSTPIIMIPIIIGISLIVATTVILVRKPARSEIVITDSKVIIKYYYFQKLLSEDVYFKEDVLISFFTVNFPYPSSYASHILLKIGKDKYDLLFFVSEFNNALSYFETLKDYNMNFDEGALKVLESLRN